MPTPHRHARREATDTLARVAPLVTRWIERVLALHDPPVTLAQYLALTALADEDTEASQLARRASVSPGAVSQLVAGLESAGLIERARAAGDRRRQPLALTGDGRRLLASARTLLRERIGPLLAELAPPEADALARLLSQLERKLGVAAPPPRPPRPPPPGPRPHRGARAAVTAERDLGAPHHGRRRAPDA